MDVTWVLTFLLSTNSFLLFKRKVDEIALSTSSTIRKTDFIAFYDHILSPHLRSNCYSWPSLVGFAFALILHNRHRHSRQILPSLISPLHAPCDRGVAFNFRLWGYRHGRSNRQRYRVIRMRNDGKGASSKAAVSTLGTDDTTGAGQAWSKEELDIDGTYKGNLVVVVGELLPDVPDNTVKTFKRMSAFDFDHHTTISTLPNLPIVV